MLARLTNTGNTFQEDKIEMDFFLMLCLCFIVVGHQSSGLTTMFASVGGSISLPCGSTSPTYCSSVNWKMKEGQSGIPKFVVKSGKITNQEQASRLTVAQDCSLQIHHLNMSDGVLYICEDTETRSEISLELLKVDLVPAEKTDILLQCYLNNYNGSPFCNETITQEMKWLNEDETEVIGTRFRTDKKNACFHTLFITPKKSDHHRKWTCQVTDINGIKTSYSYTTSIPDGIEEVFAVVGESVSLRCDNASSLVKGSSPWWRRKSEQESALVRLSESETVTAGSRREIPETHMNHDSSLVINKVRPLHSGYYTCSLLNVSLNRIKLHTLEVTAEWASPGRKNLTLTCLLMCGGACGQDLNLTWAPSNPDAKLSTRKDHETLVSTFFLPDPKSNESAFCSVYREGVKMATRKWPFQENRTVILVAWLVPLLILLLCLVGGSVYYLRKKFRRATEEAQGSIGMVS
ncbi:uncharacterized protein LOC124477414 isoform X2 [Hypomesus transpacificus]|uniref:uncharacterized protein LOC124477414 isoform X2 n=1 Tax=Hypomesus transpacificus TaxID=137520 RepID=UPI001F078957|nr:uncharacterized protein LOC124477414 isoform X2 [Hypomesus transpacificus]